MRLFAIITVACLGLPLSSKVSAQSGDNLPDYARAALTGTVVSEAPVSDILQVQCSSCGTLRPSAMVHTGCSSCGSAGTLCGDTCQSGLCRPGSKCRYTANCGSGFCDTFFGGLAECLCCPDPCYEPMWVHTANAAFFQDTVRPKTYTRYRFDTIQNMSASRIGTYFMSQNGPASNALDSFEVTMYQEVASDKAAFFIEMPYRSLDYILPGNADGHNAGFVDMNLGTKSLLLDCELLQLTFQFKTFLPTGASTSGLGTGHVSLEPSFLASLKLFDATYLQQQVAYWIPISGDPAWSGAVLHYHWSINHLFAERGPWQIIGTAEFNGWSFTTGSVDGVAPAGGKTYCNIGPGLRFVYCDNYDFGLGYAHALSEQYLGQSQWRAEFRIRF